MKKLAGQMFCLNMKKAKNQRRLVIIVALVGVYYLGKHSSSYSNIARKGELKEERFPRLKLVNEKYSDLIADPHVNNRNEVLKKGSKDDDRTMENARAKHTNINSKPPPVLSDHNITNLQNHKASETSKQHKSPQEVSSQAPTQSTSKATQSTSKATQSTSKATHSVIASTGQSEKIVVETSKPKPTVITAKTAAPTTKPTASQTASADGSTSESSTDTPSVKSSTDKPSVKSTVNVNENNYNIQDLLKDKNLFGFVYKNQSRDMNILKAASYSKLLEYQLSKRTKAPPPKPSDSSNYLLYKYGYSRSSSDKLPILRDLPDNRDTR